MPKYKTPAYISQEAKIQAALEAYENPDDTEITSLRIAAGVFNGVSYSTLNHRYKKRDLGGSKTLAENGGHNKKLNEAQEASLICELGSVRPDDRLKEWTPLADIILYGLL
ncbi:hypothetical protein ACEPPN_006388 [Leptodophora sp. 'Broadleaf-Isolate-01']